MTERMSLTIIPPAGESGELTVIDAMQQVLDAFKLLADGRETVWRLVSASTNSPLTIIAEADDADEVREQMRNFAHSLYELRAGRFPEAWKRPELLDVASAFLRRSSLGISRTEFNFGQQGRASISSEDAFSFLGIAESAEFLYLDAAATGNTKKQRGSIEGVLGEVTTYYGKPAIRVRERKSQREVICIVSEDLAETFESHASIQDVWLKRRVTVFGDIHYRSNGVMSKVEAINVVPAEKKPALGNLSDPDFTGGLSAAEYLDRFRAGEIG